MKRGEIWFAATGIAGDRPVLVLTRDPVADRIDRVVVAQLTRTIRGLMSELLLGFDDGVREECAVTFDNLHTLPRDAFRRRVITLSPARMHDVGATMNAALGCHHPIWPRND